jgi:MYXO-CTERM domain-containing protein
VTVGGSACLPFTIYNVGQAKRSLGSRTITGAALADYAVANDSCVTSLSGSAACTFEVCFVPTVGGSRAATLQMASDDPFASSYSVLLDGTGLALPVDAAQPLDSSLSADTFAAQLDSGATSDSQQATDFPGGPPGPTQPDSSLAPDLVSGIQPSAPDAGALSDTASASDAGQVPDAAAAQSDAGQSTGPNSKSSSGCSCSVEHRRPSAGPLLLLVLFAIGRRRARS